MKQSNLNLFTRLTSSALSCLLLDYNVVMTLFQCVYLCKYVFVCRPLQSASAQHMAVWCMVSAPWSLLICLTQCSRSPLNPYFLLSPLSLYLRLTAHTKGKANLLFSVNDLLPVLALLLFSPSPLHWLNLFSGLILLKTIWCVTSSGQEAGRGEW